MSEQNKKYFEANILFSAFKAPFDVGALCSSSSFLASSIVDISELKSNENIVELGAGTGVITCEIIARLPPNCSFTSVEKNPLLARVTKNRFKNEVDIIAADIRDIEQGRLGSIDCLVSSLPMTLWKTELQKDVISSIFSHMSDNGRMIFFSYVTSNIFGRKKMLMENLLKHFSQINEHQVVWRNTPPARIYVCTNS